LKLKVSIQCVELTEVSATKRSGMEIQRKSVQGDSAENYRRELKRTRASVLCILGYLAITVFVGTYFIGKIALKGKFGPINTLFGMVALLLGAGAFAILGLYTFLVWRLFWGYRGLERANPAAPLRLIEQTLGILLGLNLLNCLSLPGILFFGPLVGFIGFAIVATRRARRHQAILNET
jgi:hypothetical protein